MVSNKNNSLKPAQKYAKIKRKRGVKNAGKKGAAQTYYKVAPGKAIRKEYKADDDKTLTPVQAKRKGFRTLTAIRYESNQTLEAHKSGYHEQVVTTDLFKDFDQAKDQNDGTHIITFKNPFIAPIRANSKIFKMVAEVGDGFRSDTARTVLSGSAGSVAGHAGSDVDTTGQPDAHDVLRKSVAQILSTKPGPAMAVTKKSIAVAMGSVAVASMAPGELASTAKNIGLLKNKGALKTWEADRNEVKDRLGELYSRLTVPEQNFVNKIAGDFMKVISPNKTRVLQPGRSHSPMRSEAGKGIAQGGSYNYSIVRGRSKNVQVDENQYSLFLSQVFRAVRRH